MKTHKIYLIRHGLYEGCEEGKYIGHTDVPLSAQGIRQLEEMRRDYEYPEADAVLCSPLDRCIQTARILYPDRQPLIFDGLIEYDFGEFEEQTAEDLKDDERFAAWLAGGSDAEAPFGETNAGFQKRVCTCFYDIVNGIIKAGTERVAVITHGGVIMSIMQMFAIPEMPMHEWLTPCGCGYVLNVIPSIWFNTTHAEMYGEVPLRPMEEAGDDDAIDWDREIDPEEFRGFYTPQEQ